MLSGNSRIMIYACFLCGVVVRSNSIVNSWNFRARPDLFVLSCKHATDARYSGSSVNIVLFNIVLF